MTEAKDISNWIITLVILAVGLWVLLTVGKAFIAGASQPGLPIDKDILASVDSISLLLAIGVGVIVLLLIPIYIAKRSQEKKEKISNKNPSQNV